MNHAMPNQNRQYMHLFLREKTILNFDVDCLWEGVHLIMMDFPSIDSDFPKSCFLSDSAYAS